MGCAPRSRTRRRARCTSRPTAAVAGVPPGPAGSSAAGPATVWTPRSRSPAIWRRGGRRGGPAPGAAHRRPPGSGTARSGPPGPVPPPAPAAAPSGAVRGGRARRRPCSRRPGRSPAGRSRARGAGAAGRSLRRLQQQAMDGAPDQCLAAGVAAQLDVEDLVSERAEAAPPRTLSSASGRPSQTPSTRTPCQITPAPPAIASAVAAAAATGRATSIATAPASARDSSSQARHPWSAAARASSSCSGSGSSAISGRPMARARSRRGRWSQAQASTTSLALCRCPSHRNAGSSWLAGRRGARLQAPSPVRRCGGDHERPPIGREVLEHRPAPRLVRQVWLRSAPSPVYRAPPRSGWHARPSHGISAAGAVSAGDGAASPPCRTRRTACRR